MNFSSKFKFCPVCGSPKFVANNFKSKKCEDCGFVYYLNPSAATAAFVKNSDGEILVCRRAKEPAKGTLDLPGGFSDFDETVEECMCRELAEEIGVKVRTVRYLFSLPNKYSYSGLIIPTMDMFFDCTLENYDSIKANDDVEDCFFVPIEEINESLFGLDSIRKAVQLYKKKHSSLNKKINFA